MHRYINTTPHILPGKQLWGIFGSHIHTQTHTHTHTSTNQREKQNKRRAKVRECWSWECWPLHSVCVCVCVCLCVSVSATAKQLLQTQNKHLTALGCLKHLSALITCLPLSLTSRVRSVFMCDGAYQLDHHHLLVCLFAPVRGIGCTYGSPARLSRPRSRCLRHTPRSDGYICRCRSGSLAASRWEAL